MGRIMSSSGGSGDGGQRDGGSNGEGVAAVVAMEVTTMVIGDDSGCGNGGRDNGAGWW